MLNTKTLNIVNKDGLVYITFPNMEKVGVTAAFTTRLGGVSCGQYASMNMSFTNGDDPENVRQNYNILFSSLGLDPEKAVISHQTHTDNIRIVTKEDIGKGIIRERDYKDVDGLVTNIPGVALVTQFADCVPLLFFDPKKQVIAASHAGWRGTVLEIGLKTVKIMRELFGSDPADILAAIGPSIGKCCYEVDDPVALEIEKISYLKKEKLLFSKGGGKYQLDLKETNRQILINAGIKDSNICVSDLCTCCHSEIFHSHRATAGKRGNLAAVIALK